MSVNRQKKRSPAKEAITQAARRGLFQLCDLDDRFSFSEPSDHTTLIRFRSTEGHVYYFELRTIEKI